MASAHTAFVDKIRSTFLAQAADGVLVILTSGGSTLATFGLASPAGTVSNGKITLDLDLTTTTAVFTGTAAIWQLRSANALNLLASGTIGDPGSGQDFEFTNRTITAGNTVTMSRAELVFRADSVGVDLSTPSLATLTLGTTTATVDNTPPSAGDGVSRFTGAESTTVTGVQSTLTATFADDPFFGQYWDGGYWIAPSGTATSVFLLNGGGGQGGSNSSVSNGIMKNPLPLIDDGPSLRGQGWDSNLGRSTKDNFGYHFDASLNIKATLDGTISNAVELVPGDCIVLSDTHNPTGLPNLTGRATARYFEVIHVVSSVRDRRETLRPGPWGVNPGGERDEIDFSSLTYPDSPGSGATLLDLGVLPDFDLSYGTISAPRPTIPDTGRASFTQPFLHYVASFIGDTCSGDQHVSIETQMMNSLGTLALACVDSGITQAQRREYWHRHMQMGVDITNSIDEGDMYFPVSGGSNSGFKLPVVALRWSLGLGVKEYPLKGFALANPTTGPLVNEVFSGWWNGSTFTRSVPIFFEDYQTTYIDYAACLADDTDENGTPAHGYLAAQDGMPESYSFSALNFPDGVIRTLPDSVNDTVDSIIAKGAPNKNWKNNNSRALEYRYVYATARGQVLALRALGASAVTLWNGTMPSDFEHARGSFLDCVDRYRRIVDGVTDDNGTVWNQFNGSGLYERSNMDIISGEHFWALSAWNTYRGDLQDAYWGDYDNKTAFEAFASSTHGEPLVTAEALT